MDEKSIEKTIDAADDWNVAARRDIDTYKALVRCRFIPFLSCMPKEPHMALHHLQQAIEKMVKAMAIASGKFTYEDLKRKYGHDSLSLYADLIEKIIEIPAVKVLIDSLQGKLKTESEVKIVSQVEAYQLLEKIKANIRKKGKEIPNWYYEFALLPEKPMKYILNSMIKRHNKIRVTRFFLRLIPDGLFTIDRDNIGKSMGFVSNFLSKRGYLVNERMRQYFNNEAVKSYLNKGDKGEKIHIIEMLRNIIMCSYVLGELLMLSAFTFAHGISTRYPGNRFDKSDNDSKFNDTLYDDNLGVVRCLAKLGRLAELVSKEMDEVTVYTMEIFDFFNSVDSSTLNDEGIN